MATYIETNAVKEFSHALRDLLMDEDEDDSLLDASNTVVELGFLEPFSSAWKRLSKHFPCKVGGKPAWLNLRDLPDASRLQCGHCQQPMILLLQVYAPIDQLHSCFHRTLFVFLCKDPECCRPNSADNFAVFRCQLPRGNAFYSYEPPADDESSSVGQSGPQASDFCNVCNLCGCLGPKRCSRCRTNYCSVQHQRIDWKSGHKAVCKDGGKLGQSTITSNSTYLLPEYEIVTEPEEFDDDGQTKEQTEKERIEDYKAYVEKLKKNANSPPENIQIDEEKDLESMAASKVDKQFQKFRRQIEQNPHQVLRYHKGGDPLWISSEHIPGVKKIPCCTCGATRHFEFQILPQLLNHLKLDDVQKSIDWGTLVIYTCSKNCNPQAGGYQTEFIIKQDILADDSKVAD